jgi:hypothetical protein
VVRRMQWAGGNQVMFQSLITGPHTNDRGSILPVF